MESPVAFPDHIPIMLGVIIFAATIGEVVGGVAAGVDDTGPGELVEVHPAHSMIPTRRIAIAIHFMVKDFLVNHISKVYRYFLKQESNKSPANSIPVLPQ